MKIQIGKIELTDVVIEDAAPTSSTRETLQARTRELEQRLADIARGLPPEFLAESAWVPRAVRVALAEVARQGRTEESTERKAAAPAYASSSSASPAS